MGAGGSVRIGPKFETNLKPKKKQAKNQKSIQRFQQNLQRKIGKACSWSQTCRRKNWNLLALVSGNFTLFAQLGVEFAVRLLISSVRTGKIHQNHGTYCEKHSEPQGVSAGKIPNFDKSSSNVEH